MCAAAARQLTQKWHWHDVLGGPDVPGNGQGDGGTVQLRRSSVRRARARARRANSEVEELRVGPLLCSAGGVCR